ncbi:fibronectin type III domain-containing protein [Candidatus Falkowbacteria bacterium]|jgi:hypothetical protein|nr:fibronectin type III domain-containing protein [Candidatus Falkowbacteria bacterium]MBT4433412.1 fibronectin type III domain-containing protein [Candidatus Falkowbacteria bacterium]
MITYFKKQKANFLAIFIFSIFGLLLLASSASANVTGSGTYVSSIEPIGFPVQWGDMTWTVANGGTFTIKVRSCDDASCSGETAIASCPNFYSGSASGSADITSNGCVSDGDDYVQYQVYFSKSFSESSSTSQPTLTVMNIAYASYTIGASTLTSSKYEASTGNVMGGVGWDEDTTLPDGTEVAIYLKTAATEGGLDSATWYGVATSTPPSTVTSGCTKVSGTVSCNSTVIPESMITGGDDDWFQYKIKLVSDGANTPTVDEIIITYVVNAPPAFDSGYENSGVGASQGSDGQITIAYSVKDEDTTSGNYNGYVEPTYYYSLNGGSSWTEITSGLSANATTNKTVVEGSYTEHNGITWNPKSMIDDNYSATAQIKVSVFDGEAANHTAEQASASFTLDTTDPAPGATPIIIKATSTPAVLTISATDNSSFQMKVGLVYNGTDDITDASWESYAASDTISLASDPDTVYVLFKDAYSNTSTVASLASIETPSYMMIQDTTNLSIPEYREFVSWKVVTGAADFAEYRVLRSESEASGYSIIRRETDRLINSYVDTSVVFDDLYYYKVAHVDNNGNTSYLTSAISGKANGVQDFGEGGGGTSGDAPNIDETLGTGKFEVTNINSTSATINWETTDSFGSDSVVEYVTVIGGDFDDAPSQGVATVANTAAALGKHSITLTGLEKDTVYYIRIRSTNPTSNLSDTYKYGQNGLDFETDDGPIISAVSHGTPTASGATVTWTTDKSADSYVYYSESSDMSGKLRVGSDTLTTSHSVDLAGLTLNTTYYYYIVSADSEANTDTWDITDNGGSEYPNFTTANDTIDPIITVDPTVIYTTSTATVVWTTDETSYSKVYYATDTYYTGNGSTYSDETTWTSVLTRNHAVNLVDLTPGVTYHYQVESKDGSTNENTSTPSTDATFVLTGVATSISSVAVSGETSSGATITWTTGEASDSVVEYNTVGASNENFVNAPSQGKAESVTSHSVTLTGLSAGTTYYFRVNSTDSDGNTGTGAGTNFDTTAGPSITFVKATDETVTQTTATITWSTDLETDGRVVYSVNDDMSHPITVATTTLKTAHEIVLNDLTLNSTYYYYLQSTDAEGNIATDNNSGSYWPLSTSDDTTDPEIIEYSVVTSTSTATITWKTDELSTSRVRYDSDSNYSEDSSLDSGPDEDTTYTISHSVVLTGLTHNTNYWFNMLSNDARNNGTPSDAYSFVTIPDVVASCPACPPCRSGGGGQVCPKVDTTAPSISMINIQDLTHTSAKIAWKTNENATSIINYGLFDSTENSVNNRNSLTALTMDHLVSLDNLLPQTTYYYQLASRDKSGNLAISDNFTFQTKTLSEGLLEKTKEDLKEIDSLEARLDAIKEEKDEEKRAVQEREANSLLLSSLNKVNQIVQKFKGYISVDTLELSLKDSLSNIEKLVPSPTLEGIPMIEVEEDKVTISWGTNKGSNSVVLFVPEEEYTPTSQNPYIYQTGSTGAMTTDHKVVIPNLAPGTTYHFQVQSKAPIGPEVTSENLTFTTLKEIPKVTVSQIIQITDNTATIAWETNTPTDSLIRYIPYDEEEERYDDERAQIQGKVELVKNHVLTIENLVPGTTYGLTIEGRDELGQTLIYDMGELNTSKDIRSPEIMNVKTESSILAGKESKIQTIIFCSTDEDSTSQIIFAESHNNEKLNEENIIKALEEEKQHQELIENDGIGAQAKDDKQIFSSDSTGLSVAKLNKALSKKHITVLTNFKSSTAYAFRIISVDPSGNRTISEKYVLLTPEQSETVIDMIIKTFETRFSWLGKFKQ